MTIELGSRGKYCIFCCLHSNFVGSDFVALKVERPSKEFLPCFVLVAVFVFGPPGLHLVRQRKDFQDSLQVSVSSRSILAIANDQT